jgi:hypothetical protein
MAAAAVSFRHLPALKQQTPLMTSPQEYAATIFFSS